MRQEHLEDRTEDDMKAAGACHAELIKDGLQRVADAICHHVGRLFLQLPATSSPVSIIQQKSQENPLLSSKVEDLFLNRVAGLRQVQSSKPG